MKVSRRRRGASKLFLTTGIILRLHKFQAQFQRQIKHGSQGRTRFQSIAPNSRCALTVDAKESWLFIISPINRKLATIGYFDGIEREYCGFGMVEQWDTELHSKDSDFPKTVDSNWDTVSWSAPTLTRSWFHAGAFFEVGRVSQHFEHEYWVEPGLQDDRTLSTQERKRRAAARSAMFLPDTVIEESDKLSADELREAYRVLKGSALRIEVYAEDRRLRHIAMCSAELFSPLRTTASIPGIPIPMFCTRRAPPSISKATRAM